MYRINEKNQEGAPLIPFTDEDYLHPEDIHEDWIFIPNRVGVNDMIRVGRFTMHQYLTALDCPGLVETYNMGALEIMYEDVFGVFTGFCEFCTIDPTRVVGTLEAISSKGIYIRPNALYQKLSTNNPDLHSSMRYLQIRSGYGIDRIIGWVINRTSLVEERK